MNKFMRLMVFFDLPVVKDKDRKAAAKFRRFLLKDGYVMVLTQYKCISSA